MPRTLYCPRVNDAKNNLYQDAAIIAASIAFAVWLSKSGTLHSFLMAREGFEPLESFIAGFFFTSAFTTAPAIAALAHIADSGSILNTAFFGGLGALAGDLVLYLFVKDRFSDDLVSLISKQRAQKVRHIFRRKLFRWFSPFVATVIIASPFPDELGIILLGFAKTRAFLFIPFSLLANFLGILAIAGLSRII